LTGQICEAGWYALRAFKNRTPSCRIRSPKLVSPIRLHLQHRILHAERMSVMRERDVERHVERDPEVKERKPAREVNEDRPRKLGKTAIRGGNEDLMRKVGRSALGGK
jgi:hypothetical protein